MWMYNLVCILAMVYMLWKYRDDSISVIIICLFFGGVPIDLGGNIGRNVFRIAMLAAAGWKAVSTGGLWQFVIRHKALTVTILLYILYFVYSSILINGDNVMLVFSLLSKTITPLLLLTAMLEEYYYDSDKAEEWFWLFGELIVVQILLSIAKMVVSGGYVEGWIGSMTGLEGGGAGTSFPLLGLMWLALKTDMRFKRADWLMALGLLIIGFAAGKRAVWFLFPVLFLVLTIVVYRHRVGRKIVTALLLTPIFFYLALRISPTFNPENKVWGSFDPEFAIGYIMDYTGGMDKDNGSVEKGVGRLGAITWLWAQTDRTGDKIIYGRGNEYLTYGGSKNYTNASYLDGIQSRGNITGIVNTFFSLGIIGVVLMLALIVGLFLPDKSAFNITLLCVVLLDYIFYNAQIVTAMPLFMMALYLSFFSHCFPKASEDYQPQLT